MPYFMLHPLGTEVWDGRAGPESVHHMGSNLHHILSPLLDSFALYLTLVTYSMTPVSNTEIQLMAFEVYILNTTYTRIY